MGVMAGLVAVGGLYLVAVLVTLVGFCWYVVHVLRDLAAEQERTREKLDFLLARQREWREHAENDD